MNFITLNVTRISFHCAREYASAVMMGLICPGVNVMPLSIFKVRIIRVISLRKPRRFEQRNILFAELGS